VIITPLKITPLEDHATKITPFQVYVRPSFGAAGFWMRDFGLGRL
jgi:hypothetical protein